MCKNQWFEENSKLIEENKEYSIYRYSCNENGIVSTYKVLDGIEIVFMDFNTYLFQKEKQQPLLDHLVRKKQLYAI